MVLDGSCAQTQLFRVFERSKQRSQDADACVDADGAFCAILLPMPLLRPARNVIATVSLTFEACALLVSTHLNDAINSAPSPGNIRTYPPSPRSCFCRSLLDGRKLLIPLWWCVVGCGILSHPHSRITIYHITSPPLLLVILPVIVTTEASLLGRFSFSVSKPGVRLWCLPTREHERSAARSEWQTFQKRLLRGLLRV